MNIQMLNDAIALGEKVSNVVFATADGKGLPHIAAAAHLSASGESRVTLKGWFCPGTVANLSENARLSLVVWDWRADEGYQLLGRVETVEEIAIADGYLPQQESPHPLPQVERQLHIRVEKVMRFTHAPHSDLEE